MFGKSTLHVGALSAIVAATLMVAGCGSTPGDRIVSGGLLGAGAGAAIGSLSANAGKGAIIGGIGGAAIGALTTPAYPRYSYYRGRCVRWSSYTGRCVRRV